SARISRHSCRSTESQIKQEALMDGVSSLYRIAVATDIELVRNILLALLASLAKVEAQKISDRTKPGMDGDGPEFWPRRGNVPGCGYRAVRPSRPCNGSEKFRVSQ